MAQRVFTQTFCVVGAIVEQDGRVLLVKENSKFADRGKWNQPAGWVDVGEDPSLAAVREVKEETGLDFSPDALVGIYSLVRQDLMQAPGIMPHAFKLIFRGTFRGTPSVRNDEISELRWFSLEEIEAMDTKTLRDLDIKQEVRDYLAGRRFSLDILRHTVQR